ncbi:MAG: cysteine desulfurase family protein [Alphaproteobacteria bacterium]
MSELAANRDVAVYLDANASMPLLADARVAMVEALSHAGNASSTHAAGRSGRARIERGRDQIAALVGVSAQQVIFTSGATEAAAMALTTTYRIKGTDTAIVRIYIAATEHACVRAGGAFPADRITVIPVTAEGTVDCEALTAALADHDANDGPPLVAVMLANNETGIINPVAQVAGIVHQAGGIVYCDAVQAAGRLDLDIAGLGVDLLALSAHKLGGPQGIGALILADNDLCPVPLIKGGGQEKRRRAGTENIAAIAGFGVAASLARNHMGDMARIGALRDGFEAAMLAISPDARIVGNSVDRLANTSLIVAPGQVAETVVIAFDLDDIAVSAGSACSSGKVSQSHVLAAMGLPPEEARAGIRFSLHPGTTQDDIDRTLAVWQKICRKSADKQAA